MLSVTNDQLYVDGKAKLNSVKCNWRYIHQRLEGILRIQTIHKNVLFNGTVEWAKRECKPLDYVLMSYSN